MNFFHQYDDLLSEASEYEEKKKLEQTAWEEELRAEYGISEEKGSPSDEDFGSFPENFPHE